MKKRKKKEKHYWIPSPDYEWQLRALLISFFSTVGVLAIVLGTLFGIYGIP